MKKVDYKTLLFFIGLFIVVGGLEQTGILELIAGFIAKISGDNAMLMIAIVLWVSAIASAFVDNIPFAATMVPVIRTWRRHRAWIFPCLPGRWLWEPISRQRNTHRRFCQCCGNFRGGQGRTYDWLGKIL